MRSLRGIGRELDRVLERAGMRSSLRRVARLLDQLTPHWSLGGGSCLGYVRNGRPIPGDLDMDIGIYDPDFELRRLAKYLPITRYFGIRRGVTQVVVSLEATIDVYVLFDYGGWAANTLFNDDRNEVKFLLYDRGIFEAGVRRALFCGVECNVLKRAHDYCRTQYGDSYMSPDPHYHWWDSPRSGVLMDSERMFVEDVPRAARAFGRSWVVRPTVAARKVLAGVSHLAGPMASRLDTWPAHVRAAMKKR